MWKDIDGFDGAYQINENEEVYSVMEDRISMLEGALCNILDLLED